MTKTVEQTKKYVRVPARKVIKAAKHFADDCALPAAYGKTRLVLLVKDPFWIYAYWEITEASIKSLEKYLAQNYILNAPIVLRMYDVTLIDFNGFNAKHYFDINVEGRSNNWYINLWNDDVSYIGEIGIRTTDGRFFALARSNHVHTPRAKYSPRSEQIWMKVQDNKPVSTYITSNIEASKKGYSLRGAKKGRIHISDEDLREYYTTLSPLLKDIISKRLIRIYGRKARIILEGGSAAERRRLFSRLPKDYFIKKLLAGSSIVSGRF